MKTYKFRNKNKTIKGGKFSDWKLQLEGDNFKSYTNDKYVNSHCTCFDNNDKRCKYKKGKNVCGWFTNKGVLKLRMNNAIACEMYNDFIDIS